MSGLREVGRQKEIEYSKKLSVLMPYKDQEYRKYYDRCRQRTRLYGNWRQIYYNHNGVCANPGCGEPRYLEFHESFGSNSPMSNEHSIVLLCGWCHAKEHPERLFEFITHQPKPSMLSEDVAIEMETCGGLAIWMEKYGIVDS